MTGPNTTVLNTALSAVVIVALIQRIIAESGRTTAQDSASRNVVAQLGPWASAGRTGFWNWRQASQALGPQINARLADKFCGLNDVHLSRVPHGDTGTACWAILLGLIHSQAVNTSVQEANPKLRDWSHLPLSALVEHDSRLCVQISRATLMTLFALTNARPIYRYSSASGHRSAYPAYCGQWTISWPIGKPCVVRLAPHDSHSAAADVYPPSFPARVDKCVHMMAGIVTAQDWKLAFPGRAKSAGPWVLREKPRGFGGAHGSRHLYNMQGGRVFEVDLLALMPVQNDGKHVQMAELRVPRTSGVGEFAVLYVPEHEANLLSRALNSLPWSSLSWSLHRGLKDILLAYGKPVMNRYRTQLASLFTARFPTVRDLLVKKGWAPELTDGSMAGMAESAILAGGGNSGDVVRIVVAIVETWLEQSGFVGIIDLDQTTFWTKQERDALTSGDEPIALFADEHWKAAGLDMIVALTKFFVLEWSQDLDYQLYHDLPVDVLLA